MAMNLDEYRRLKPPVDKSKDIQAQRLARQAVAEQCQIVVDHPAWQLFLNHLQAVVNDLTTKLDDKQGHILRGKEVGEMLTVLKMECLELEAERRGLKLAMEVIPTLIKRGQDDIDSLTIRQE